MSLPSPSAEALSTRTRGPSLTERLARRALLRRLEGLPEGEIEIVDRAGRRKFGRSAHDAPLRATVTVHDPRFYLDVALGGTIGAGESYMRGSWTCDSLTDLVRIMVRNRDRIEGVEAGLTRLKKPLRKLLHRTRENTRAGSRRNISAHYDLGNDFFSLFLDPTMTYSCGVFESERSTMEEASRLKNDLICRKLELTPRDELLEIGTGWGAFAEQAARDHGCRVVTTTISRRQHEYAKQRIRSAGLEDRVTLLLEDYRDLPERLGRRFDKLVSIEMIEAVGHRHFDTYFETCSALLEKDGTMLLQAIVIADPLYERYRRSVDFIQRYIFPGGCLPSIAAIRGSLARATDMSVRHLQEITPHYPRTLRSWKAKLTSNADRVRELGYPERLLRMWEFYLCYCEGGFLERSVGDVQLLLGKPHARPDRAVPEI